MVDVTSWQDAVLRLDRTDHRSRIRVYRDLARSANAAQQACRNVAPPLEQRRHTALLLRDALAAYRLAGGTPEHLGRVLNLGAVLNLDGDVVGSVGDRARIARERIRVDLEPFAPDGIGEHAGRIRDVNDRAATLEQPRATTTTTDADGDAGARPHEQPDADGDTDTDPASDPRPEEHPHPDADGDIST
jgi:hypothetical protein